MHAILLATGERPGLEALGPAAPRPLLPLANRPVMTYAVEWLARAGVREATVCLHDRGGAVEAFFGDGMRWGVRFTYALLREPLGSGGALRRVTAQLRETTLVLPADALLDLDIAAALDAHRASHAVATVVLAYGDDRAPVATGAMVLEPSALAHIPPGASDLVADLVPALRAAGLTVHEHLADGYWNPLDTPAAYQAAQRDVLLSAWMPEGGPLIRGARVGGRQVAPGIWVGRGDAIHPAARLAPPVYIGDGCRVGREAEIGPFAVIGDGCVVGDEATVRDSTVLARTYVGRLVEVDGRVAAGDVLVDAATGDRVEVADPLLLAPVDPPRRAEVGLVDRAVALALLLLLLPALLVLAALVAAASGGRPLRRDLRVAGLSGAARAAAGVRTFGLLRFAGGVLGGALDRTRLDHLPSLWNVVRGDLALVGVRPLTLDEAAQVCEEWQLRRYERPAGLTGLWLVQGGRDADLTDWLVADTYYVTTRTRWGDMALLLRTPAVIAREALRLSGTRASLGSRVLR